MEGRAGFSGLVALGALLCSGPALAATWTGGRTTPSLAEMFAIDATGESGWLYGQEDIAGDGLDVFNQQEKNIDIRTAYSGPDSQALWLRVYVSDTAAPGGNVAAYFFIDTDRSAATGGKADSTTIDPQFTTDTSPGGYEYAVGVKGNGSALGIWNWNGSQWTSVVVKPGDVVVEVGADLDPIKINGDSHGYLQARVLVAAISGLTAACNANLYVRSSNDNPSFGAGDLEVGQVGTCDPSDSDSNGNGIPDPLEPDAPCSTNAECPGGGICQNGTCIFATPCVDATDCKTDEECAADGVCRPRPTGNCSTNPECVDLVCEAGKCVACTPGGSQCGDGRICAPTGRCIAGTNGSGGSSSGGSGGTDAIEIGPGQEVQGGACMCSTPSARTKLSTIAAICLFPLAFVLRRRRRRSPAR